jgi:hypothetical protein
MLKTDGCYKTALVLILRNRSVACDLWSCLMELVNINEVALKYKKYTNFGRK